MTSPLITAAELRHWMSAEGPHPVLLDCSFDLSDTTAGERDFASGHLPGARYLHLDRDLSGPHSATGPREGGRHPLPMRCELARRAGQWGIGSTTPVVCYDRQGASFAARAWWLLRWMGHARVQVLDGGLPAWVAEGGALETQAPALPEARPTYPDVPSLQPTITADELLHTLDQHTVIDARAGERYRGEIEPLDGQAGHIPGAINRFFKNNLQADGRFKSAQVLCSEFDALNLNVERVVHQCGSGVTACHNVLAMAQAGWPTTRLYPGSWSEWSADPARPVAKG
jgi:thiosulfate/3-mercaptopyruvate sulfurtransferase